MARKAAIVIDDDMRRVGGSDPDVLERFMKEFFPYGDCRKIGIFSKELKGNYYAQAKRICDYFGYDTVFEYGAKEVRCHISYAEGRRPPDEPFVTVFPSIYE